MQKAARLVPTHASPAPPQPLHQSGETQRDLWKLLDALAFCRKRYDLAASSLSVLRALISFLPKTAPANGALLVWPSNRALCERADGMDERTLRRHINRLISAGLIQRRSSSNGKRFALRCRRAVVAAFGFDLSPMREQADHIAAAAALAQNEAEQGATLRVEILNLLHRLGANAAPLDNVEEAGIRRMLRRTPELEQLCSVRDRLSEMLLVSSADSVEMPVSDRQNDRHQQNTEKESYDSVCLLPNVAETKIRESTEQAAASPQAEDDITLEECLNATTEGRAFAQEPVRTWSDLIQLADTLAPMIGIERELTEHSKRAMGPLRAAISILCIIQRADHIRRPAAYLRRLALLAETGQYSLRSLVRGALRTRFTAANHAPA